MSSKRSTIMQAVGSTVAVLCLLASTRLLVSKLGTIFDRAGCALLLELKWGWTWRFSRTNTPESHAGASDMRASPRNNSITVAHKPLSREQHRVVSELKTSEKLEIVQLRNCGIKNGDLKFLLKENDVQVVVFDVSANKGLGKENMRTIGELCKKWLVETLDISECHLGEAELTELRGALTGYELKVLKYNYVHDMTVKQVQELGSIVKGSEVKDLYLMDCDFKGPLLSALEEGLRDTKVNLLDMSFNRNMDTADVSTLANIVRVCRVESLRLADCDMCDGNLTALKTIVRLPKLDLSFNSDLSEKATRTIGEVCCQGEIQDLTLVGCKLNRQKLQSLSRGLGDSKLKKLNIRSNHGIDSQGFREISSHLGPMTTLIATDCGFTGKRQKPNLESLEESRRATLTMNGEVLLASAQE